MDYPTFCFKSLTDIIECSKCDQPPTPPQFPLRTPNEIEAWIIVVSILPVVIIIGVLFTVPFIAAYYKTPKNSMFKRRTLFEVILNMVCFRTSTNVSVCRCMIQPPDPPSFPEPASNHLQGWVIALIVVCCFVIVGFLVISALRVFLKTLKRPKADKWWFKRENGEHNRCAGTIPSGKEDRVYQTISNVTEAQLENEKITSFVEHENGVQLTPVTQGTSTFLSSASLNKAS